MPFSNRDYSIDVIGPVHGATGWATHALGFARAMNELAEVRLRLPRRKDAFRGLLNNHRGMLYRGISKECGDFGVVIHGRTLCPQRSSRWNVWETTELPAHQKELCDQVGFVWAPSSWGRDNLIANGIEAHRVAVVPEGVDTDFFTPSPSRERSQRFRFLSVGKWECRKFTDGLVRAFAAEFSPREDVELYLQAHNPYIANFSVAEKLEQTGISNLSNIVIGKRCGRRALRALYRSADCFVLPTRAEGWGLPILESMACGVPAIVTGYSAPLDYVTADNGFLLKVARLVDAHDPDFNICTGQWAEPDIDHLRFLMRQSFQNASQVRERGQAARSDVMRLSWRNSAQIALQAIERHLSVVPDQAVP